MPLIAELKRRNVFRVAIAYAALAWLMAQVAEFLLDAFGAPAWVLKSIIALFLVGFPFALFFSWAYELTPEGIRPEREVAEDKSITRHTGRRLDRAIIVLLVLALAAFGWDQFSALRPESPSTSAPGSPEISAELPQPAAESGPPDASIAVLPFTNMSDDPANVYFSEGISEEILNLLAKLPSLHVTSRSSSFQFEGGDVNIPTVAAQLGVAHVLEGSVRKSGNRVRITAQLIDARADRHLWSETWDRQLDDIFAIQDEIAGAVAVALEDTLLPGAAVNDLGSSTRTDSGTYELFLRGRHLTWQREKVPLAEAVQLFQQAIGIDPDYAPAYAGLATALYFQTLTGAVDALQAYTQIDSAIATALTLDPDNAEAYAALGLLRAGQGRFQDARAAFYRAIEINPNDAQAYYWLSSQDYFSDPARALELAKKAYAIDPLVRVVAAGLAWRLEPLGRYDEAMAQIRTYHERFDDAVWSYGTAADIFRERGQLDLAVKANYRVCRERPDVGNGYVSAPLLFLQLGEPDIAAAWMAELQERAPFLPPVSFNSMIVAAVRGQLGPAIEFGRDAAAKSDVPWFDFALALGLLMQDDNQEAVRVMEQSQPGLAEDPPEWQRETWPVVSLYAAALYRTGDIGRAEGFLAELEALLERQVSQGVATGPRGTLREELAMIQALRGRREEAFEILQSTADQGITLCVYCFDILPHYDTIRDDPRLTVLYSQQRARLAGLRQRLADEGMLLTPQEVQALEAFEFDPLAQ